MEGVDDEMNSGEAGGVSVDGGGEKGIGETGGVIVGSSVGSVGIDGGDWVEEFDEVVEGWNRKVSAVGMEDVELMEGNIDSINSTWRE